MRRREFIRLLGGGAAAAWPLTARAQAPDRMRRVGVLMNTADDSVGQTWFAAFSQGLQQLGWEAGRNVQIDTRWGAGDTERYRRLARFVDAFFNKIATLQQPPFHPKWKEVALNAPLPGWLRFRPAQQWLDRNSSPMASADTRRRFDQFLSENQGRAAAKPDDREALFRQFLEWQKSQSVAR